MLEDRSTLREASRSRGAVDERERAKETQAHISSSVPRTSLRFLDPAADAIVTPAQRALVPVVVPR